MATKSYDKAYKELQGILEDMQGDATSIDKLSTKIKKAQELLSICKARLRQVESEIHQMDDESE